MITVKCDYCNWKPNTKEDRKYYITRVPVGISKAKVCPKCSKTGLTKVKVK